MSVRLLGPQETIQKVTECAEWYRHKIVEIRKVARLGQRALVDHDLEGIRNHLHVINQLCQEGSGLYVRTQR